MKTYYIRYPRNFSNEYDLCYCETPEQQKEAEDAGYERITRKEAIRKCSDERWAREHDQNFSGYGDADIVPWTIKKWNTENRYGNPMFPEEKGLHLNGYIWE